MTTQAVDRIVLNTVRRAGRTTASDLFSTTRQKHVPETEARQSVWRLIDRRVLRLTPDRKLQIAANGFNDVGPVRAQHR